MPAHARCETTTSFLQICTHTAVSKSRRTWSAPTGTPVTGHSPLLLSSAVRRHGKQKAMPEGAATAALVRGRRQIGHARTSAGSGKPPGASGSGGGGGGTGKRCDGASAASAVPNHHSSTLKPRTAATRPGRAASTTPKQDCSSKTRSAPRRPLRAASMAARLAAAERAAHACTSSSRARTRRMRMSASSGLCVLAPRATNANLPQQNVSTRAQQDTHTPGAPAHEAGALRRSVHPWVQRHERALQARARGWTRRGHRLILRTAPQQRKARRQRKRHVPATPPAAPWWRLHRRGVARTPAPPWP